MTTTIGRKPRNLSYDEMKAAEAAFQGRPFREGWSEAARVVYEGIVAACRRLNKDPFLETPLVDEETFEDTLDTVGAGAGSDTDRA